MQRLVQLTSSPVNRVPSKGQPLAIRPHTKVELLYPSIAPLSGPSRRPSASGKGIRYPEGNGLPSSFQVLVRHHLPSRGNTLDRLRHRRLLRHPGPRQFDHHETAEQLFRRMAVQILGPPKHAAHTVSRGSGFGSPDDARTRSNSIGNRPNVVSTSSSKCSAA